MAVSIVTMRIVTIADRNVLTISVGLLRLTSKSIQGTPSFLDRGIVKLKMMAGRMNPRLSATH